MKKNLFLIALVATLFISCNNEKIMSENVEYEDMYKQLHFERLKDFVVSNDSLKLTRGNLNNKITDEIDNQISIGICKWEEWGRTSRNCKGFGLCRFTWTPLGNFILHVIIDRLLDSLLDEEYVGVVNKDDSGNPHMYIRLAKAPTQALVPDFIMDEDVVGEPYAQEYVDEEGNVIKGLPSEMILKKGIYSFNPNIGEYGGYEVDIEVIQ